MRTKIRTDGIWSTGREKYKKNSYPPYLSGRIRGSERTAGAKESLWKSFNIRERQCAKKDQKVCVRRTESRKQ